MSPRVLIAVVLVLAVLVGIWINMQWEGQEERRGEGGRSRESVETKALATYVGGETCAACHKAEHETWVGSHHDLAMQVAKEDTVLGDFNETTFTHFGVTSRFFKRDGKFFTRTDGPDGKLQEYEITFTFGVDPLQQYLIEFPDGRYQVLSIAWDTRPKDTGGQRWFHLYPDEKIPHDDLLHWTGPNQNWNYMCAACHSTNLQKGYEAEEDRYTTRWSDLDVSCEACHGPGSQHVAWAKTSARVEPPHEYEKKGLLVQLEAFEEGRWIPDPDTGTARRATPIPSRIEMETCARCHSRRALIHEGDAPGKPFLDSYLPALLEEGLYHADGQIQDEVYVHGSFVQSKMFHAGVTCSDCHQPHSLKVRALGNALCTRCHVAERFDTPKHSFHEPKSPGAQCVECHMPANLYMVVDPRRDHSFRIPRPDVSMKVGSPNACTQCHRDRSPKWAAEWVAKWYGPGSQPDGHYGEALHAGREGLAMADQVLASLAREIRQPAIARGTALTLLRRYPTHEALQAITQGLRAKEPLVQIGALRALQTIEPARRLPLAEHLLGNPFLAVRVEAARALAPVSRDQLTTEQEAVLREASAEYIQAQLATAERPSSHLNLGIFYAEQGQMEAAETAYRKALTLDPSFVPAYVNLADLYRVHQRDHEGETLLRQALDVAPKDANVHQALGLLLVRLKRQDEAIEALAQAAKLEPNDARQNYVYAIALNSVGQPEQAIAVLETTHHRHPNDRQILGALVSLHRDGGNREAAIRYAKQLVALSPQDQAARQVLEQLESKQKR